MAQSRRARHRPLARRRRVLRRRNLRSHGLQRGNGLHDWRREFCGTGRDALFEVCRESHHARARRLARQYDVSLSNRANREDTKHSSLDEYRGDRSLRRIPADGHHHSANRHGRKREAACQQPVHFHRRTASHGVARRSRRARRARIHPFRAGLAPKRKETRVLDPRSRSRFARNQRARYFRCRRCAPRLGQARGFGCWRRSCGRSVHASVFSEGPMSPVDPTRIPSLVSDLRKVPAFADQPQPDLEWFVSQSEERRVAPGEITVREDTPADKMFVLLEGEIRARRESGPADGSVFTGKAGSVAGVLPFSRMKSFPVTGRAVGTARILDFPAKLFPELFQRMPELSARLVGLLTDRVRDFTRTEQQHEKLAALGKLSAGLAHELNNPAAAARRSAGALRDCLQRLRDAGRTSTLGPEDCGLLAQREEEIRVTLKPPEYKDEFVRVEREEAIQAWLEAHKVVDAWKLAPLLAD